MVTSVDPDQMPHSAASDLGLHCNGLSAPILGVITVVIPREKWRKSEDPDQTLFSSYAFGGFQSKMG